MKIAGIAVGFGRWGGNQILSLGYAKYEMPFRHLGKDTR